MEIYSSRKIVNTSGTTQSHLNKLYITSKGMPVPSMIPVSQSNSADCRRLGNRYRLKVISKRLESKFIKNFINTMQSNNNMCLHLKSLIAIAHLTRYWLAFCRCLIINVCVKISENLFIRFTGMVHTQQDVQRVDL